jgi:hypothetical protein
MSKQKIQVVYAGGKSLLLNDSLEGALATVLNAEVFKDYFPLKLVFPGTGKILFFDDHLFRQFLQGDIDIAELVERTECDELYRNWLEVEVGKELVEPGALWKLKGKELTLVDEDRCVTCFMPSEGFSLAL